MSQFLTVLNDALRLLRAKALFWVTLAISALAALLYLSIGFDEKGVTLMFGLGHIENEQIREGSPAAEMLYLGIFTQVIVGFWLSWVAVGLALITCAPMFPDFMGEGSAGAVLCKPISRLKLFIYKYLSGLLFALLQTTIFCVIVFIAVRWRLGTWNPTIFWAVPLVVLMFSYLWSVMVAVAVKTRSTMASLLAAIAIWFLAWLAAIAESFVPTDASRLTVGGPPGANLEQQENEDLYRMLSLPYMVLPKTSDTVSLLNRWITVEGGGDLSIGLAFSAVTDQLGPPDEIDEALEKHPAAMIIGTSLGFELVVLVLGAWVFCRRDF